MKKRLGIFLCVWNGEKTIENSINSILRQKYKGLVNLYILDNQSEDTTIEILRKILPQTFFRLMFRKNKS